MFFFHSLVSFADALWRVWIVSPLMKIYKYRHRNRKTIFKWNCFWRAVTKRAEEYLFFFFGDNNNTHFVEVITGARFVVIFSFFSFCFSLFSVLHFLIDKIDMIIFDVCFFSTNVIEREEKEKTQIILNCGELSSENRIWSVVRSIRVDLFFVVALCANRSMNRNHKSKAHNLRHEQKRTKHEERMNKSSRKKKEKK